MPGAAVQRRTADPFRTARLRRAVLDAWSASPDRLREDANAEADLALGAYRGAVLVELAQNAADAAARAGTAGDLLLRLDPAEGPHGGLVAANTGGALDAAGVRALASLRASAKRTAAAPLATDATGGAPTPSVGRFGVGFAAVLAVSDEPRVVSRDGGVRFSRRSTRESLTAVGTGGAAAALRDEVEARGGDVPVLRLPWPLDHPPPGGYDTAVVLPLRDAEAHDRVVAALDAVGDPLLLALPGLRRIIVERPGAAPRVLEDVGSRWLTRRRSGTFAAADLAGLPVEEAQRAAASGWSLTWALPVGRGAADGHLSGAHLPGVLLAPTPTQEPLPWPAVLVLVAPLDATRRALARGPAAGVVLAEAARAYADLMTERAAAGDDALDLVPAGVPAGGVDADLRAHLLHLLPSTRLLPPAGTAADAPLLRPRDAVVLDGPSGDDPAVLTALAPLVGGLALAPRRHRALLAALGAGSCTVADVVEAMPLTTDAVTWRSRARALAGSAVDAAGREQLALLPVPLAGGRGARGARGLLLAAGGSSLSGALTLLAASGLRAVDPELLGGGRGGGEGDGWVRDLLTLLGAVPASARTVLEDPSVALAVAAVHESDDGGLAVGGLDVGGLDGRHDAHDVAEAVLALVSRALDDGDLRPGDLPALADLPLTAQDGALWPAAGLVLPGSPAALLLDPEEVAPVDADLVSRWGAAVLEAVGVATTLGLLRLGDVDADDPPDALLDVDGGEDWLEAACPGGGVLTDVVLVRDLDLVLPERRADLLALVAGDADLRPAVVDAVHVLGVDGAATSAPSHAAWWLGHELDATARADPAALPALSAVLGACDAAVAVADPGVRRALGTVSAWDQLPAAAWDGVLDRSLTAGLGAASLLDLWAALARAAREDGDALRGLEPPDRLVALDHAGRVVVVGAEDVVVVDDPRWLQVAALGALIVVPGADAVVLADVLDTDLASERGAGARVTSAGTVREVPEAARGAAPGCPAVWTEHARVVVDVAGTVESVRWWVQGDEVQGDEVHADGTEALACALAAVTGAWGRRHVLAEVLAAGGDATAAATALAAEAAGG